MYAYCNNSSGWLGWVGLIGHLPFSQEEACVEEMWLWGSGKSCFYPSSIIGPVPIMVAHESAPSFPTYREHLVIVPVLLEGPFLIGGNPSSLHNFSTQLLGSGGKNSPLLQVVK